MLLRSLRLRKAWEAIRLSPCWNYFQQDVRKQHTNLIFSFSLHIWRVAYARFFGENSKEGGKNKSEIR
ncbi:hypothetical protein VB776_23585 [Arcicella sp. DC2W]|uniref:Uncharacterized protein n=1 Tax=Arcicella gelida TaxID=2984195 RepID=A0ABU5SC54_9BACT|nr:hypothetical protein [Arcicella sp. DC2W]MEA5405941.1 hypothetical protein [Arcicella sp. DC2W]